MECKDLGLSALPNREPLRSKGDIMMKDMAQLPKLRCRSGAGQGGFSLIEVMTACIVLMVGVIGAFAYFTYSRGRLNLDAHKREALQIATARMEEIRGVDVANIAGCAEAGTSVSIESDTGHRTTTVTAVDEDGDTLTDYYQVSVTVSWTENARTQSVQLVTDRSQYR